MLAVALGKVFRTAMHGRCDARPDLAGAPLPLEIHVPALPVPRRRGPRPAAVRAAGLDGRGRAGRRSTRRCRGGATRRYVDVTLTGHLRAGRRAQPPVRAAAGAGRRQALLGQHRRGRQARPGRRRLAGRAPGAGADHPPLPRAPAAPRRASAAGRLAEVDDRRRALDEPTDGRRTSRAGDRRCRDAAARRRAGRAARRAGARRVVDLGCGEGALLARAAAATPTFTEVVGVDVSRAGAGASPSAGCSWTACRTAQRARLTLLPVVADLPRRRGCAGLRRRGADGGHRAPRPRPAAGAGARRLRRRPAARRSS